MLLPRLRGQAGGVAHLRDCRFVQSQPRGLAGQISKAVLPLTALRFLCRRQPVSEEHYFLEDWETHPFHMGLMMTMDIDSYQLVLLSGRDTALNKDILREGEDLHISGTSQMPSVPNMVATW